MIRIEESYYNFGGLCMDWSQLGELATEVDEAEDICDVDLLDLVDDWLWDISEIQMAVTREYGYGKDGDSTDITYQEIGQELLKVYILPFVKKHGYVPDDAKDIPGLEDYITFEVDAWKDGTGIDSEYLFLMVNNP